ncbi:MAG: hypothetical protein RLZZ505_1020 [Verrucomicrobiota bacterium]
MARKRTSSDGGISLDSLMDALTNVVAVLILVLILVQADVSQKVQKFLDDLQPATPEEVAASKKLIEELQRKQRVAEARLREKPASPQDIAEEKRQIALLEKSMQENKQLLADLDKVRALEKTVRAERDAENQKTVVIQKEIARLEGLLDTIPAIEPDTPTVVNIPNSRPIPAEAASFHAIVSGNRVHMINTQGVLSTFRREFERKKADLLHQRVNVKGKSDQFIYDPNKIAAHFKDFNWGDTRGQKIEIRVVPTANYVLLVITPDLVKGGVPVEELRKPGGEFARAIQNIRQTRNSVLLYRVHTNAFETYLAARELSEIANVAAGWDINGSPNFSMGIPNLTVRRLQEPPRSKGGGPPRPPGLKPKLD